MISKDFLTEDVPSNELIIEKQIVHMAESVILTEKNDQIDEFLTDVLKKFKKIKKDDIVNKFITLEFNKLLSYYNRNKDVKSVILLPFVEFEINLIIISCYVFVLSFLMIMNLQIISIKKINKKVRKLALAQTLSKKNLDKKLYILADVKKEIKKTKEFNNFL